MTFANGVKELTLTTGTGAVTLTPISGYVPFFAAFSISDLVPYAINDGLNWEWGVGTVGAANTLARTTVQSTYVSGTLTTSGATPINLSGGATVFCTITAEEYAIVAAGGVTGGDSHNHTGGGGAQIDYTDLASLPTLGSAAATDSTDYAPAAEGVTNGDSHKHDGGDGAQIAYASLSGLPTLGSAAAAATGDFEAAGAVSTHNAASGAHGATATGAAVLTAASQSAGRTALGLGTAATTASTAYATATQGSNADSHASNTSNPHSVTAAQVGAPSGSGNSTGTNTGNETATTLGALLNSATSKTTPADADRVAIWNSISGLLEYLSWANLKTALSSIFPLLAGKSGGQTIVGGSAAWESLTLKATSHASQGLVRIDNGALLREVASKEYVQSRVGNLISNGSGLMLDNYNFSSFTFDSTDVAIGAGSFRINVASGARFTDEFIPVDTAQRYVISMRAKSGDVGGGNYNAVNKQYGGLALYDIDGNVVTTQFANKFPGSTDTTLAAALNPGDTTITLVDATGWSNSASVIQNNFVWYGYTNSKGHTYPNYTYSRLASNNYSSNSSLGAWASGAISGNVITLRVPWAGPALSIGAAVRNNYAGGTYKYSCFSLTTVPNTWTTYSGYIGGLGTDSIDETFAFRHGTAYVRGLWLVNYHGSADNNLRISGMQFANASSANLESQIGVGASYKTLLQSALPANGMAVEGKAGFGTATPSSQLQAESVTDPFRSGYSATQYFNAVTSSAGVTTFNMVGSAPAAVFAVSDATANAIYDVFTVAKNSSGAGGAGLGARLLWAAKSSTTVSTRQASLASEWVDATHATRKARITISASDYSGAREGFRCESDGTQIKTSVNGVPAAARAAALTAEIPGDATRDELRLTELYNACKNFGIIN